MKKRQKIMCKKRRKQVLAFACVFTLGISGFAGIPVSVYAAPEMMSQPQAEEKGVLIPQFMMTPQVSSEETSSDQCFGRNVLDGKPETMWHTTWSGTAAKPPHWIILDLGRSLPVQKLYYLPRQNSGTNGMITNYKISVSMDGKEFQEVATGTWKVDETEKTASFDSVQARYIRLEGNDTFASCAELNIETTDLTCEELWNTLKEAESILDNAQVGDEVGKYPQEAYETLETAIADAKTIAAAPDTTKEQSQEAAYVLKDQIKIFLSKQNRYGKEELGELIDQANELLQNTSAGTEEGQVSEETKVELQAAIQTAEELLQKGDVDSESVHQGYLNLQMAIQKFQDHVIAEVKSLAGTWRLKLGSYDSSDEKLEDICVLPGTLDENEKGTKNSSVSTNKLNRKYTYTGPAVYQKQVYIPQNWEGKSVTLLMERTKITRVWMNGKEQTICSSNNALGVPQIYQIEEFEPGKENTLTIEVTNDDYPISTGSHMLTEETVTNWNGIIGKIQLEAKNMVSMDEVRIYPDIEKNTADIKMRIKNSEKAKGEAVLCISAKSYNHEGNAHEVQTQEFPVNLNGDEIQDVAITYAMGENPKLWSEFDPAMYHMDLSLEFDGEKDKRTESFGMREFSYADRKFTINGTKTFLRGEGNSAVFPLTGYPYMTKEEWLDFFGKAQELGINFFRFHSWTPPEAAFEAADELGIYMQPELYGFGGTPFKPNGNDTKSADYFKDEAVRILHALANHPSFVMMSCGNELDTVSSDNRTYVNQWTDLCKSVDDTRLYAEGTNNNYWNPSFNEKDDYWTTCKTHSTAQKDQIRISFSWADDKGGGTIETLDPNTDHTYDGALEGYEKPIMNHEAGQYQVLPNFDEEIPKYSGGVFEARNLKYYRDLMESNGLLYMNEIFSKVSARVSAIGYRADMETALRSNDLAGYQLLSIQDFPGQGTAHVGILDNFMEDKEGGFTKEQYKNFNQETVVLGKLPQLVFTNDQTLTATAIVSNYSPDKIADADIFWRLKDGDEILESGILDAKTVEQGQVTTMGEITAPLNKVSQAVKLTLEIGSEKIGNTNTYDIWVYPSDVSTKIPENVTVAEQLDEDTQKILEEGGKVLLLPTPNTRTLPESTAVRWTTDYWSRMFHKSDKDAHTMGMYVQNTHPVFKDFPTEYFNDYQWFHLMKGSRALILDNLPKEIEPLAWNIDHMQWGRKLGSLFEANVGQGRIMVCTFDLKNQIEEYPEAKQLYRSILDYMASDEFAPKAEVTVEELKAVIKNTDSTDAYERIEAETYSDASDGVRNESGKEEGSSENQTAVGGLTKSSYLKYPKVDFGDHGADKVIINGANANDYSEFIDIYDDDTDELIAKVEFEPTKNGWGTYCSQEFEIPRQTGVKNLRLEFEVGAIAFNYFRFKETEQIFMNPYKQLDPESVSADIVITDGENGSHRVMQNYVSEITNEVKIQFNNVDFGNQGSSKMTIQGRALSDADVTGTIQYEDSQKGKQVIPFIFHAGEGEAYELSSETFFKQTVPLAGIKGVQNLIVSFDQGTKFDFEALVFTEAQEVPKEYTKALEEAETIFRKLEIKPLYYTQDSVAALKAAYDTAKTVDTTNAEEVKNVTDRLNETLDQLVETGKAKSAYTITYARNYDEATGNGVKLERKEDQVVGGFDKGEELIFQGIDFGDKGAIRLTVRAANGRSETEKESIAKLNVWYGDGKKDYVQVTIPRTGGWGVENDTDITVEIPAGKIKGVKDIKIELAEGALAFHSFTFEELAEQEELSTAILEYAINLARTADTTNVIETVKAKFEKALADAEKLLADVQAGAEDITQSMIDESWQNLVEIMQYLSFKQGDKKDLEKVIALAEDMNANLDEYLEEGKDDFTAALNEAKEVYKDGDAMQEEVNESWQALLTAMSKLMRKPDKSALEELLKNAKTYLEREDEYEAAAFTVFETAYKEAAAVFDNEQASGEEVEATVKNLKDAISKLEISVENPDKTAKEESIKASTKTAGTDAAGGEGQSQTGTNKTQTEKEQTKSAKTGDVARPAMLAAIMAVCAAVLVKSRKRRLY